MGVFGRDGSFAPPLDFGTLPCLACLLSRHSLGITGIAGREKGGPGRNGFSGVGSGQTTESDLDLARDETRRDAPETLGLVDLFSFTNVACKYCCCWTSVGLGRGVLLPLCP